VYFVDKKHTGKVWMFTCDRMEGNSMSCVQCGSENVYRGSELFQRGLPWPELICKDCRCMWKESTDGRGAKIWKENKGVTGWTQAPAGCLRILSEKS
jgi:hypothetical protein